MLVIENLAYSYPGNTVFTDVTFSVKEGEFVFLIGRSGCGKSTLLQMIYMNLFPDNGLVQVDEFASDSITVKEIPLLRRKIGVVFQDFKLLEERTIEENLAFVLEVTGASGREIKRKINDVLTEVGLNHRRKSFPDELSGGEQQRVAIARSIINDPVLVVADEPTGNLDPETSAEILALFQSINRKGTAVLFATHNYELIKKMPARIIKLENGKSVPVMLKKKTATE